MTALTPRKKRHVLSLLARPGAVVRFFKNPKSPLLPKIGLVFAALYLVSPIDAIPDLTPILGWIDDAGLMTVAVGWLLSHVQRAEEEHDSISP